MKKPSKATSRKNSCPVGKIRRTSYHRKGYERKPRKLSKNRMSKGAYVSRTFVPSTCVPAKGKALSRGSKTPEREKVLPKIGKEIHLRKYGYSTDKSDNVRHAALRAAIKDNNSLLILKHLNLIRNYQADPSAKRIMNKDVKYLSILHGHKLESQGRKSHSKYIK
jgi:hypothetical protein